MQWNVDTVRHYPLARGYAAIVIVGLYGWHRYSQNLEAGKGPGPRKSV